MGLPSAISDIPGPRAPAGELVAHMAHDKKVSDGKLTFILLHGLGRAFVTPRCAHRGRKNCPDGLKTRYYCRPFRSGSCQCFVYTIGAIVILLTISAFFSAAETALTAVSRGRMHQMEKDGSKAAANVNKLVANRERMIGAVLLGNTFINILTSSLATSVLENRYGPKAVAITTGVMTVVILIFVETMPKTLRWRAPTGCRCSWPDPCASSWRCWRR